MSIAELERSLQADESDDALAVYADALQARGDPRGELIALELALAARPATAELRERVRVARDAWLGPEVCGRPWRHRDIRHGFLDDFQVTSDARCAAIDYLRALDASPAGPYVRGLTIEAADAAALQSAVAYLATRERPWLERLAIRVTHPAPLPAADVTALIAATPRLRALAIRGGNGPSFERFDHPALRALALHGHAVWPAAMPRVTTLALVVKPDFEPPDPARLVELVARAVPDLRRLDLSDNEPAYPTTHPHNLGALPVLGALSCLDRLTHVRLPSLRSAADADALRALLARMPALEELAVARAYTGCPHVVSDPRVVQPAPWPWPPDDQLSTRTAVTIELPGAQYEDDLAVTACTAILARDFDGMPPDARAAWTAFWQFYAELPWEDDDGNTVIRPFPLATLRCALEAIDDVAPDDGRVGAWGRLRAALRAADHGPDAVVAIQHYWGW